MLELRNITKTYETGGESVHALKGVDIAFRENEFVSILGSSGCGKTTLLNIMGGLDHYTSGDLIINGVSTRDYKDADWDAYRNNSIGFVFQSYNLIPHQSVLSNVELALTLSGVSAEERRERAIKVLTEVGLGDQLHKRPSQMSGGQMQRVAIARALINDPDILLADEPTGALDTETSVQIMDILKSIASDRLVIMVTHNPELAERYSSRIIKLKDGLITGDSNPYTGDESSLIHGKAGLKNKSMGFGTALGLSFNNLMTKKARTILTAFAGSIGIIGIALILSVSTGFQNYIDKIENDTLSSYPFVIQKDTADMSSLLTSFAASKNDDKSASKGKIKENQMMAQMFANIGSNDLASFKKYVEKNNKKIDSYFNDVVYNYGIVPQIYSASTKYGALQVNPSFLMNSSMSSMMGGGSSDIFFKLSDNADQEKEKYTVAYGKWPEKYNEMVLVLDSKNSMNDYMAYSLGLRDPEEMSKIMTDLMSGKSIDFEAGKPLEWTYEDLAELEFSLVNACDYYEYDSSYDVFKSKRNDKSYMKKLVRNGERMKITCIAYPNKDNAGGMVNPGIGYLPSLVDHVIDNSAKSDIVKKQLANKNVDVFSGKTFKSLQEDENQESLGFDSLISIDKNKLASAFGGKVSEQDMRNILKKYSSKIEGSITADTTSYKKEISGDLKDLVGQITSELIAKGDGAESFTLTDNDINKATACVLSSDSYASACKRISKLTGGLVASNACSQMLNPVVSGYSAVLKQLASQTGGTVTCDMLKSAEAGYIGNDKVTAGIDKMAQTLTEVVMKATILTDVGKLTGEITKEMASAFNVDQNAIASAFKFNMSDDDITQLVQTLSSGNTLTTLDTNLNKLGYADYDKPSSISFYLKDFQAKEDFLNFIEKYNDSMKKQDKEESVISYTDVTGVMIKSVKTITNAVSYVLIAFVAISLIVSSIMIGIITYISVLERTKEIGILRAIGASKKDISRVFNSETIVVGLGAGLMGVIITLLLLIPINVVFLKVTGIAALKATLPVIGGIILIAISVLLTFIAGLIPSKMAAKKDPVEALRSE